MFRRITTAICLCVFFSVSACAEVITLITGRSIEGAVLQEDTKSVTLQQAAGTITLPRNIISKIEKAASSTTRPTASPAAPPTTAPAALSPRIPAWSTAIRTLAAQPWAAGLIQIPATVVGKGQLKFVPYISHRCGADYEVNIYGDPEAPACIEIGIYRTLLKNDAAKANCVNLIASILPDATDRNIARVLDRRQDLVERNGLTIEITPETAEDAYGGWWISVYDAKALDAARASPAEIAQITMPRSAGGPSTLATRPVVATTPPPVALAPPDIIDTWGGTDLGRARPPSSGGSGGGTVYVRGYTRKDGTYVSPHTRAAPGSGRKR